MFQIRGLLLIVIVLRQKDYCAEKAHHGFVETMRCGNCDVSAGTEVTGVVFVWMLLHKMIQYHHDCLLFPNYHLHFAVSQRN